MTIPARRHLAHAAPLGSTQPGFGRLLFGQNNDPDANGSFDVDDIIVVAADTIFVNGLDTL